MRPISFQLSGGIGNQLFALCAGKYFEAESTRPVEFFFEHVKGDRIDEVIELEGAFGHPKITTGPSFVERGFHVLASHMPGPVKKRTSIYDSSVVGYDSLLKSARNKDYVRGYFQSHVYADTVLTSPVDLSSLLISPSDWYHSFWADMKQVKYGSVHIRRGDYTNLKKSIGLLSHSYYSHLFRSRELINSVDVWLVFSDEPSVARDFIQNHMPANSILVEPPPSSKPIETMAIMSNSQVSAIANSTFSWWGAYLGRSKKVIAPSPWFRNSPQPSQLVPKAWNFATANWED